MFPRHTTHSKDGKAHTYYRLVRSVRVGKSAVQQTVAHLGRFNAERHGRTRALAAMFTGDMAETDPHATSDPAVEAVP